MYIITSKRFTSLRIKNKKNNNKHVICQLYNLKLQRGVKSNPKTAQLYKKCVAPKNTVVKKDVKSKVAAKKWL